MSLKRKLRRRTSSARSSSWDDLFELAGWSLGYNSEELSEIARSDRAAQCGVGDIVEARALELLELVDYERAPAFFEQKRAELEQRNGAGFIERVRAIGTPASEVLGGASDAKKKTGLGQALLALVFLLWSLLSPAAAAAAGNGAAAHSPRGPVFSSHKIQGGTRRRRGRAIARNSTLPIGRKGLAWVFWARFWERSSGRSVGCAPRFGCRRRSRIGCGREHASSTARGGRIKSSWCGGGGDFASAMCRTVNRTSQLSTRTGRLSVLRGVKTTRSIPPGMTLSG